MALEGRLTSRISRLNHVFSLIEDGDRVMVACSGGKDSWALLHLLRQYTLRLPFSVSLVAMNLDQGQPGFEVDRMRAHLEAEGFEHHMVYADTYSVVLEQTPPGKTYCSRCSRMRRAILHRAATDLGANKIALGHHRDDLVETLMLNMMYSGRLRTMPPVLAPHGGGAAVIRPLLWCAESDLAAYAALREVPILPCNLCGNQADTQRTRVKQLLEALERDNPRVRENLLAASGNVEPEHLLDRALLLRLGDRDASVASEANDPARANLAPRSAELPRPRPRPRLPVVPAPGHEHRD